MSARQSVSRSEIFRRVTHVWRWRCNRRGRARAAAALTHKGFLSFSWQDCSSSLGLRPPPFSTPLCPQEINPFGDRSFFENGGMVDSTRASEMDVMMDNCRRHLCCTSIWRSEKGYHIFRRKKKMKGCESSLFGRCTCNKWSYCPNRWQRTLLWKLFEWTSRQVIWVSPKTLCCSILQWRVALKCGSDFLVWKCEWGGRRRGRAPNILECNCAN